MAGPFFFARRFLAWVSPARAHLSLVLVLWLTGVDYFSTLGYQPGIALLAAGALAVPATAVLVVVTLLGAVPIYAAVAKRSYAGQGSIALLENLFSGWTEQDPRAGATRLCRNRLCHHHDAFGGGCGAPRDCESLLASFAGDSQMRMTLILLLLLAIVFMAGFREAIRVANFVAIPYLVLNLVVLLWCVVKILPHPALISQWHGSHYRRNRDWTGVFIVSALIFPKLALGLSGFETGVSVMPLVSGGGAGQETDGRPFPGAIRATRKLAAVGGGHHERDAAALQLCGIGADSGERLPIGGPADGRAIAYLAHLYLGNVFGTVYDISTILILWFAGASAMAGLLNLIPRYLPRYGMAPDWVAYQRPLVLVLLVIDICRHIGLSSLGYGAGRRLRYRRSGVDAFGRGGRHRLAVARGQHWIEPQNLSALFLFLPGGLVFLYTTVDNVIERPDGAIIASIFIFLLLTASALSRIMRSTEMRVSEATLHG